MEGGVGCVVGGDLGVDEGSECAITVSIAAGDMVSVW